MKLKITLICCLSVLITSVSLSGENQISEKRLKETHEQTIARINDQLTKRVSNIFEQIPDLTSEQKDSLTKVLGKKFFHHMMMMGKIRKLHKEGANRQEIMAVREEMRSSMENHKAVRDILTKKQFKAYKKVMEKMKPKRKNRQGGPGGHGMGRGQGREGMGRP